MGMLSVSELLIVIMMISLLLILIRVAGGIALLLFKERVVGGSPNEPPHYKGMILLSVLLNPLFGGQILYYGLKDSNEALAHYSNRWSFLSFLLWLGLISLLGPTLPPLLIPLATTLPWLGGIGMAIFVIVKMRRSLLQET
jgi:hypothetical protein